MSKPNELTLKGNRIAVTGGAGFIGSHLVDKLAAMGKEVVVFDDFSSGERENVAHHAGNPRVKVIEGDVRDVAALDSAFRGVDTVFHLATNCVRLSLVDPKTNHEVNATGTLNTLMAAKKSGVSRFVYCSSSEVYGNIVEAKKGEGVVLSEDSPMLPTTVYGASKLVGEYYTLAFHQTYGLPSLVVRPFNTYGPRSHAFGPYGEVIPRFAIMIRAGKAPVVFGDGLQTRDFTYVEDTAAGLIVAASSDRLLGDSVNLAQGAEVTVLQIADALCRLNKVSFRPKHIADRPGDIRRLGADVSKAKSVLGAVFSTNIEEGLKRYLAWLDKQNLDYAQLAQRLTEKNWTEPSKKSDASAVHRAA